MSCVGEKAILDTESPGGWTSSMSFCTGRKLLIILGGDEWRGMRQRLDGRSNRPASSVVSSLKRNNRCAPCLNTRGKVAQKLASARSHV